MSITNISGSAHGKAGVSVTARLKHHFSKQHLRAAEFFAEQVQTLNANLQTHNETQQLQHRAYVTGAVLSAVAFLEASINELYLCALDGDATALPSFDAHLFALFTQFWEDVEKFPLLHKYQVALTLAGKNRFDPGSPQYQDTESLVKLRDCLVHYRPEWDDESGRHQKLENRLKGKFGLNKYVAESALWFPHQCLSDACAGWAVATARNFSNEFCKELAIPQRVI
ncbi:MAG TPA: hypothetical protein VIK39_02995 [Candidatus Angelobacter sp.]